MQLTTRLRCLGYGVCTWSLATACDRPDFKLSDDVPVAGFPTLAGGGVSGVAGTSSGAAGGSQTACTLYGGSANPTVMGDQTVSQLLPARRELYALVTDGEAQALRDGAPLVPPAGASASRGALGALLEPLRSSASDAWRRLGDTLSVRFQSTRSTWPNPWALRLIEHPGSERMNALRIVLRDDALIVRLAASGPSVFDVENSGVAVEVALAEPERVAAIYYQVDRSQPAGATDACESGMREIALGSDAMVEEWSLGTPEVEARRTSDIDRLERLFSIARGCPSVDTLTTFRAAVVCDTWPVFNANSELSAYQWALATPVEAYKPTPQNLASLIQALQDDEREPDPFIVRPPPPPAGGGASGGAGGDAGDGG